MKRFQRDSDLHLEYSNTLLEYKNQNIIEKVTEATKPNDRAVYYLPHQPVIREESQTTKLRIVFDASSSKDFKSLSLNDCLWVGENLNSKIFDILISFRLNKIAFIADIEKAFLQVSLSEKDRDAVRFLWKEDGILQTYRFSRVLFGVTSSPFLLSATIRKHLKLFQDMYPLTTDCLRRSFYVDDFISGADSLEEAITVSKESLSIMEKASMVLRKWKTNSDILRQLWRNEGFQIQSDPNNLETHPTKVLGMMWSIEDDNFILDMPSISEIPFQENTKRSLMRMIGKIYDPLGLLVPYTLRIKCLMQEL
nr:uncharacterized protein LOC110283045 [Parasteatoda tepidariorum]